MTGRHSLLHDALAALRRARAHIEAGELGRAVEDLRSSQSATSFAAGMGHGLDICDGHHATGRSIDCTATLRRALFTTEKMLVSVLSPQPADRKFPSASAALRHTFHTSTRKVRGRA